MIKTNNRLTNSYSTNQRKLSLTMMSQSIAMILVFLLASIVQCSKHEKNNVHMNSTRRNSSLTEGIVVPNLPSILERARQSINESRIKSTQVHQTTNTDAIECPTWMYFTRETNECVCGVGHHDMVKCNAKLNETYILDCHQMTFDEKLEKVIAGLSIYGCLNQANPYEIYHKVPANRSQINEVMCSPFSRGGRLCGACRHGYSPLVYSYQLYCKQCSEAESKYNWAIFIVVAFIPLTLFYVLVVLFKFNANSPLLHGFVFFAQIIGAPPHMRILIQGSKFGSMATLASKLLATLYGVWNLDYFRAVYPDICLRLTTLQALSLDYIVAIYPLLLILISYVAMRLHSRIPFSICKPVERCFLKLRRKSSTKASMIDVFATFLLLIYSKILYINIDLLSPTVPIDPSGSSVGTYLNLDPSYAYFGQGHLPYGILALILLTTFNIAPFLLLLFYPMKCFQTCLNHFQVSHIALHTFVDSFAGCYKDRTEPGTRDCRYFAALFLFLRIVICIIFQATKTATAYGWAGMVLTAFTILLIIVQPYKAKYNIYNTVTTVMCGFIVLVVIGIMNIVMTLAKEHQSVTLSIVMIMILIAFPQLYFMGMAIRWTRKRNIFKRCFRRNQIFERSPSESPLLVSVQNDYESPIQGLDYSNY